MPVLKKLEKTVQQISEWQENCANLQHALRTLLGENVSISDVAVTKDAFDPDKKKKDLEEAEIAGDIKDKDRAGRDVIVTPEGKTKKLTPQQSREMQRNGDEGGEEDEDQATLARIRKTMDILGSDEKLRGLIVKYFDFRSAGNFGRATEIKKLIEEMVENRDLDAETVFASYDLGLGIGGDSEEDKEVDEPEEDPEEDKDSETEEG